MANLKLLCGVAFLAIPILVPAKDFPLQFKTLNAQEAMSFPGGSGLYATLARGRPAKITKEPPAVSKYPLYGRLSRGTSQYWFRLDESRGSGQGYDRLIVDLNQNGDLTDDAVATRVVEPRHTLGANQPDIALFGPIAVPKDKWIGDWQPIYFAQMYLFTRPSQVSATARNMYLGQLRLKAGWYLEAKVDLDGIEREVGVVDGNCSLSLGEVNQPTTYKNGNETNWYFQGGDYFLEDENGSGKFESTVGESESAPFGPLFYLGANPCRATLAPDCKSLALEPWTGPLAQLDLQPHGQEVSSLQVAWEEKPGQWQLLQPGLTNGKATVPPGNYRLYSCALKVKQNTGDTLILTGYKRTLHDTATAEANATVPFKCGSPLEIKVTCERDKRNTGARQGSTSLLGRIFESLTASSQSVKQLIQATVVGCGGETYSSFYLKNKTGLRQPPKPSFTVTFDGKEVGSGNLEFG